MQFHIFMKIIKKMIKNLNRYLFHRLNIYCNNYFILNIYKFYMLLNLCIYFAHYNFTLNFYNFTYFVYYKQYVV